VPYH
jgi:dynein heavy chain